MATLQVMKTESTQSYVPKNALYTCIACQVAFQTSEGQRDHYRTDWHKYNLKRKIANLSPVGAEQFTEKVLAQQAKTRQEQEQAGLIYECAACRKSYSTENAFNNHVQSKRHRDTEQQLLDQGITTQDFSIPSSVAKEKIGKQTGNPSLDCLFCNEVNKDFDSNVQHMTTKHGFFLPDSEYLVDKEGLIAYLSEKIQHGICLFCNGRGKDWKTKEAVRRHMLDRGHCKMAYDETEDPEALLKYYDFGTLASDEETRPKIAHDSLVLDNGQRIGHRRFLRQYKQHHIKKEVPEPAPEQEASLEHLPRRERRQRLAITSGNDEQHEKMGEGIKEVAVRRNFQHQVEVKHNLNTTRRLRDQVPK